VVTSWKRLISNPDRFPQASLLYGVVGARDFGEGRLKDFAQVGFSIQGNALKVQLTTADPGFPLYTAQPALFPIPSKLFGVKAEATFETGTLITAGAYVPRNWTKGQEIILERNARYYGRPPKAQRVRLIIESDGAKQRQMFLLGKTDALLDATPADEMVLKLADKDFSPLQFRTLTSVILGFNTHSPWMKELTLRKALAHGIDRARLAARVDRGWVPLPSLIPAGMAGFDGSQALSFSPEQARSLFSLLPPSARPAKLTILCEDQSPYREIASDIMLYFERFLGVKGSIHGVPPEDFATEARAQNFDLILGGRRAADPQPLPFLEAFRTGHPANWFGFSSPEVDALLTSARQATTPAQALETLRVVHKIIARDQVVATPLFQRTETVLLSPAVRGLSVSPLQRVSLSTVEM
jgi:ABC-type oligopeptide transport system substrate-binding subunit